MFSDWSEKSLIKYLGSDNRLGILLGGGRLGGKRLGNNNGCSDGDRFNRPQMRRKIVHQIPRADIIWDSGSRLIIKNEYRQLISLFMFFSSALFIFFSSF